MTLKAERRHGRRPGAGRDKPRARPDSRRHPGAAIEADVRSARRVLEIEARAVQSLADRLDAEFSRAVEILAACQGKVVVSGLGKSGIICRKIAATLASTGTPALF